MSAGTFVQMEAFGASDIYLCNRDLSARICSNNRDSIMYWFIDRKDGFAISDDIIYLGEDTVKDSEAFLESVALTKMANVINTIK